MTRLLLLGGGPAHLAALSLIRRLMPQQRIALLAASPRLLYSGMMPGWLAGQYRYDECTIDLPRQCVAADVEWIEARAVDIRFDERIVIDDTGRRHEYGGLSLNLGSAIPAETLASGSLRVVAARPFADFTEAWEHWLSELRRLPDVRRLARRIRAAQFPSARFSKPRFPAVRRLAIVGGDAAAVEIAFALAHRTRQDPALAGCQVVLVMSGPSLLEGQSRPGGWLARRSLRRAGVQVLAEHRYVGHDGSALHCRVGGGVERMPADLAIIATGAQAPGWLGVAARRDGVAIAADGAIVIDSRLRSASTPGVWASGDCASLGEQRMSPSGVHALRQARALADSLARGADADPYLAPTRVLALLNRCDGTAIAIRGPLAAAGGWAWRWKDRVDRRFVARFAAPATGTTSDTM